MTGRTEQLEPLFDSLERCQTILSDAFPHEGLKAIGGSRIFLRDPFLATLKKCVKGVAGELKAASLGEAVSDVSALWAEVAELLRRIERQDLSKKSADEINKAITLMYLANGATWNYLRGVLMEEPSHNPQYVRIEPLLPLLKRCGWEDKADSTPQQIIQRLEAKLKACLC